MRTLVLDTNVVLDLLVFRDPSTLSLHGGLAQGELHWIGTAAMRAELERVLAYPVVAARLRASERAAAQVLADFDAACRIVEAAPAAPLACSDPDDQPFIDLAVHHACLLLSKDAAVLALARRLAALQVTARAVLPDGCEPGDPAQR